MSLSSPPLLCIANHRAQETFEAFPWEWAQRAPTFSRKSEFAEWCSDPNTKHCFFSGFEGVNLNRRLSKENEPYKLRAIVADYDANISQEELFGALERTESRYRPNYVSRSFSGNVRAVWLLEEPLLVLCSDLRSRLMTAFKRHFKIAKLFPGLDERAFADGMTYYEVGYDWLEITGARLISPELGTRLLVEAADKAKLRLPGTVTIPLEIIEAEVHARFPGRWSGPFAEGARGVRFWDSEADALSAIVKPEGMLTYTGGGSFMTWAQIFGRAFVEKYLDDRIGNAVNKFWWDVTNRCYWRYSENLMSWVAMSKDDVMMWLETYGLSRSSQGGGASEITCALQRIQEHREVSAAGPYAHRPPGIMEIGQPRRRFLNTADCQCLKPAEGECYEDDFPWIANFLSVAFDPPEQLDCFLAWLKRFYETGLIQDPQPGHALFLAGDVGQGKTLMSNYLIGGLVGGSAEATAWLMGETAFNKSLYERALWTMDDSLAASDPKRLSLYSSIIKKTVANKKFEFHAKFRDATQVEWQGRVVVTCNLDPESIRVIPNLDMSIIDKVCAFRISTTDEETKGFAGPLRGSLTPQQHIERELPAFANWLLRWEIPEHIAVDPRFGFRSYIHGNIREESHDSSPAAQFEELLTMFLESWFACNPQETKWEGGAMKLLSEMTSDPLISGIANKYTGERVGQHLTRLMGIGKVKFRRVKGHRKWIIDREFLAEEHDVE
jgi:hypothetical protein